MPIKKLFLLLSLVSFSVLADEIKSNYVTFSVSRHQAKLAHDETSPAAGYFPLAEQTRISLVGIQLGAEKEFFADEPVSFTAGGGGGVMLGRDKEEVVVRNKRYNDKASGTLFNLSGSLNVNYNVNKTRYQVFGGASLLKTKYKFRVAYSSFTAEQPNFNIDYNEDGTQTFIRGGLRVFDSREEIFCIIALEYQLSSSFTTKTSAAKMNQTQIDISNTAEARHSPLGIILGFGLMF